MTNRYYESCYFQIPMLAQSGSEVGRRVQTFDLGRLDCFYKSNSPCNQATETNTLMIDFENFVLHWLSEISIKNKGILTSLGHCNTQVTD